MRTGATMHTEPEMKNLVAKELAAIGDAERRRALEGCLVAPVRTEFRWSYGPQRFDCWEVARAVTKPVRIVYSTPPPISGYPWCSVSTEDQLLGMDSSWFASLDDAFINGWWDGPLPDGYEIA